MLVLRMCNNNQLTRASHAVTVEVLLPRPEPIRVWRRSKSSESGCSDAPNHPFEDFVVEDGEVSRGTEVTGRSYVSAPCDNRGRRSGCLGTK